jgi:catechol 2,3-dioxygenase-like lactoylglutathione lyase family enzyme
MSVSTREVPMLENTKALATIAVRDTATARRFYEGALGLKPLPSAQKGVLTYESGDSTVLVYESSYAGTNKATAATWVVGDGLDRTVQELKSKGVKFEHYDLPNTTLKGDIHESGDTRVAWFKDPDGNILSLVNESSWKGH